MAREIDFHKISTHHADRRHAFEELCAQLASLEARAEDPVFHRKGVGVDAGVKCFIRYADGIESGWQAKYFHQAQSQCVTAPKEKESQRKTHQKAANGWKSSDIRTETPKLTIPAAFR